jgi:hypothetical protein
VAAPNFRCKGSRNLVGEEKKEEARMLSVNARIRHFEID